VRELCLLSARGFSHRAKVPEQSLTEPSPLHTVDEYTHKSTYLFHNTTAPQYDIISRPPLAEPGDLLRNVTLYGEPDLRAFHHTSRKTSGLFAALLFLLASCLPPSSPYSQQSHTAYASAAQEGRYYEQTGLTLAPEFLAFYDAHGGVPLFGYPVTPARTENGYLVQWTERQRLEYHPEHAGTPYEVLLGLLGRELTDGYSGPAFRTELHATTSTSDAEAAPEASASAATDRFFPETGQTVTEPFLSYWRDNGGLQVFGYPISRLFSDENGLQQQWFERARFEYHPEFAPEHEVLLGHLGAEALKTAEVPRYELQVDYAPAPDGKLQIGLAQGGESDDAGFFDNVRELGRALGPGLVRLDNIFNHFGIVSRTPDGKLAYRWDDLDRVLDGIKAMGKEPFICLSYMPETMSITGSSRVVPPARYEEWAELIAATVRHVNVERRLGVRYWEVWNEPNLWGFWQGSYVEYLRLYDVTVQALAPTPTSASAGLPSPATSPITLTSSCSTKPDWATRAASTSCPGTLTAGNPKNWPRTYGPCERSPRSTRSSVQS
jgi:hypothetical protein